MRLSLTIPLGFAVLAAAHKSYGTAPIITGTGIGTAPIATGTGGPLPCNGTAIATPTLKARNAAATYTGVAARQEAGLGFLILAAGGVLIAV